MSLDDIVQVTITAQTAAPTRIGFGIPLVALPLVLGVDRVLDMCRTTVNLSGDLVACVLLGSHGQAAAPVTVPRGQARAGGPGLHRTGRPLPRRRATSGLRSAPGG